MGRVLMTGGGGGADLDVITAEADDVLSGKVIVDKDGNPLSGTLSLSGNAGAGDVLSGKTFYAADAKSKQTGTLTLSGNAGVADVLSGKTFYTTNPKSKQTGTMGTLAGGTYTPSTSQQTISCSGKKMTGNIIIKGDGNLVAGNILNGKSIFGVAGNVRKYAVWEKDIATSGSGAFTYSGNNGSTYLPYIAVSGFGFTPLTVSAYTWLSSGRSFTGYDGYNYMPETGYSYKPNTGPAKFAYNNLVIPVRAAGTYKVRIIGYY